MKFFRFFVFLSLILVGISIINFPVLAVGEEIITFGADLTQAERDQLYKKFDPSRRPQIHEVSNSEEYVYLSKYIPKEQIGNKAISSIYMQTLAPGTGIKVDIENISWVTGSMYANAACTAGVKDVYIKAMAPFPVSGTAALTGIFKAFEKARGLNIDPVRKDVAHEELVTTGKLGEKIGKEKASNFMYTVKKEVIEKQAKNPKEIRVIIEHSANEYHIKLSPDQVRQIENLMSHITKLDLNLTDINHQLKSLGAKVKGIHEEGSKIRGILGQIFNLFQQLFKIFAKIFSR